MKVSEVMEKNIIGVSAETTSESAIKLMKSMRVSIMPVLDEGKLVGVVHEKDFAEFGNDEKVATVMRRPIFVEENSDTEDAAKKMVENSIGRLPVVNNKHEMQCVGTISSTEIVKAKK